MPQETPPQTEWIAFAGHRRVAAGQPQAVAAAVRQAIEAAPQAPAPLIFDAHTSETIELDLRGSVADVLARLTPAPADSTATRGAGRPRLGVTAREVTLLPRHWQWLAAQSGGASVTLRKLVEQAMRSGQSAQRQRRAQEAAYRFMAALAGDLPRYEDALRALFAGDIRQLQQTLQGWPDDVAAHALALAAGEA